MVTSRSALGNLGEERVAKFLETKGYEIVERNYRCPAGEIDIIAKDGSDLVFLEVKTRRNNLQGCPSEAVDSRKRTKLILSGEHYLTERNLGETDCRFDVAEVYFTNGQPVRIEIIKGAFSADY